jgi:excisionase family DNA binding protein
MTDDPTYTIDEFCKLERIHRSTLYKLWRQGQGPRYFLIGSHRRITEQARQDWHRDREAAA